MRQCESLFLKYNIMASKILKNAERKPKLTPIQILLIKNSIDIKWDRYIKTRTN